MGLGARQSAKTETKVDSMTDEQHDFENTVVAILDRAPAVRSASEGLAEAGYEYEILEGEEGREHLDPGSDDGLIGAVRSFIKTFGDQHRIIDRLDDALQAGKLVVSVEIDDEDPGDAISILKEHGGHFIWRLGEWTFAPIGD